MKETWYFIDFDYYSPSFNMALDEALLDWHSEGKIPPTLRFYGWNPPTLSLGYFQKIHQEINLKKVEEHGLGLVRRMTGGRAVLHDQELTYNVVVSEHYPNIPKTVTEAYRFISQGILEGFRELGLDAYFSVPESKEDKDQLKNPRSAICFDAPSWYELVVEGRKVAGSAQTRQKGVILQHGSILLELDENKLFDVFQYPNQRVKERLQKNFKNKAVAINQIANREIGLQEVIAAFKIGFEKGLNIELKPYKLTDQQLVYVEELSTKKYNHEDWTYIR